MSDTPEGRQQRILELMIHDNVVAVSDLATRLQVSPPTIRRDLKSLQRRGLLHRTHGGATPIDQSYYASLPLDSSYEEQVRLHANAKRRIGLAAASLVKDRDTIALTPGTTTAQVARSIHHRHGVTLLVTSVNVAMELSNRQDLTVFVPGGFMRPSWFSLIGPSTIRAIRDFYSDKVFIGVNGIHAEKGLTSANPEEAAVNRALIEHASRRIAVADHTKLGAVFQAAICPTAEVDTIITDSDATDDAIEPFEALGIEVIRA
jgi:DeoR family transcriptional regulator of aga operon